MSARWEEAKKLARTEHPETSKEAAWYIVDQLGELQRHAVEVVTRYPGRTLRELAELDPRCGKDTRLVGRRLNEVEKLGLVARGVVRVCAVSGRRAATWNPAGGSWSPRTFRTTPAGRRRYV